MNHQIRFCKSFDGVRLAYAITGEGPPLVKAPHWLTHLEHEWQSPIWKPWIESLSRSHTLLRMDERGCGLSDWKVGDISFEAMVRDLEAVVDAAGFERFALMGHSQGGAIAVEYAARHPALFGDRPRFPICYNKLNVLQLSASLDFADSFAHRCAKFRFSWIAYFPSIFASVCSLCHFCSSTIFSIAPLPCATSIGVLSSALSYTNHSSTTLR